MTKTLDVKWLEHVSIAELVARPLCLGPPAAPGRLLRQTGIHGWSPPKEFKFSGLDKTHKTVLEKNDFLKPDAFIFVVFFSFDWCWLLSNFGLILEYRQINEGCALSHSACISKKRIRKDHSASKESNQIRSTWGCIFCSTRFCAWIFSVYTMEI